VVNLSRFKAGGRRWSNVFIFASITACDQCDAHVTAASAAPAPAEPATSHPDSADSTGWQAPRLQLARRAPPKGTVALSDPATDQPKEFLQHNCYVQANRWAGQLLPYWTRDLEMLESRTLDGHTQELIYRPTLHA